MTARADLAMHLPIRLSEVGSGGSSSVRWTGRALVSDLLEYPDGTDEVTLQAKADTAAGLLHVPIVSPEDHQRWLEADARGEEYQETPLGTVLASDLDGDAVSFEGVVHDADANGKIRRGEWPAVSVAYRTRFGPSNRADRAQIGRTVRHLALVPRGRDPKALIYRRADAAEGTPMTPEEIKALAVAIAAELQATMQPMIDACGAMVKRMDAMDVKPAVAEIRTPSDGAPPMVSAEDLAAEKKRADAAEARLFAIDVAQARADGALVGLKDLDLSTPDKLVTARVQITEAALSRARADSAGSPWRSTTPPVPGNLSAPAPTPRILY
jgi:hypothetical protein